MKQLSEDTLVELSHLRWHCRRGVKELDVVLRNYLDKHFVDSAENSKQAFRDLLALEDPILMSLVMDQHQINNEAQNQVLAIIRKPYSK